MYKCKCGNECDTDTKPRKTCPDCACGIGEEHSENCDVQRCSGCGGQRLSCFCGEDGKKDKHDFSKTTWSGFWPGIKEAAKQKKCLNCADLKGVKR